MEARKRLERISRLHKQILSSERELERLREQAESIPTPDISKDRVITSRNNDRIGFYAVRIADIEKDLDDMQEEITFLIKWASREIDRVADDFHRRILTKRYVFCERWDIIAWDMGYSKAHIFRIHKDALEYITL